MTQVHHGNVSWNLKILEKKQYVGFWVTPKQTTDSIRKVNATYVSKAIPDKHRHDDDLPFSTIQDGSSCKAAVEFSTWRFRPRLIFAVFGRRLIALT